MEKKSNANTKQLTWQMVFPQVEVLGTLESLSHLFWFPSKIVEPEQPAPCFAS